MLGVSDVGLNYGGKFYEADKGKLFFGEWQD